MSQRDLETDHGWWDRARAGLADEVHALSAFRTMTAPSFKVVPPPASRPREWSVVATWEHGKVRRIKGFTSEEVALEWIAKASATWVRNLPRMRRNYGPRTRANHAAKKAGK